jgi:hypothetical protein
LRFTESHGEQNLGLRMTAGAEPHLASSLDYNVSDKYIFCNARRFWNYLLQQCIIFLGSDK